MSTNEFDRLIAKSVSRLSYEYDANDWENLTIQLAVARRKKRTVVFAYLSSGIAAAVAIFLIGIVSLRSEKKMPAAQITSAAHATPSPALAMPGNTSVQEQSQATQKTVYNNASAILPRRKQARQLPSEISSSKSPVAYGNEPQNTSAIPEEKQVDTFNFAQNIKQHGYEYPLLSTTENESTSDHKGINISLAAGVNYGTVNTGYAVGAAAGKKLSNKFGLELTVAYVSNNATTYGTQSPPNGGPIYGPPTKPTPVPEVISPLNYLQFSPMADYSISKKITLSAGADIQRLLQDHDFTVLYNDNPKIAPTVDLGMLLRTEYAISPAFKAGISYRLGANNIVAPGNNYFDRNYMQIQLKYKLH